MVISIIGMLSSIVFAGVNEARIKARDSARISALRQIQTAIEMYALENDRYPGSGYGSMAGEYYYLRSPSTASEVGIRTPKCGLGAEGTTLNGVAYPQFFPGIWCLLQTALAKYIPELPDTTIIGSTYYNYTYKVPIPYNVKTYGLGVKLERSNDISKNDGGVR